uniref:Peptide N-acetyl-beta-D-glucosaminyl asparaginase amidase A N-terminal domain-containing protein n=1 Tax=Kalanchoe fedtschenkoi TaxID=63787 RepID=A0A7N0V8Y0_KALFE
MLENLVNAEFTGVYHVNVSLDFYSDDQISPAVAPSAAEGEVLDFGAGDLEMVLDRAVKNSVDGLGSLLGFGLGEMPADLIIPVSDDFGERGFWFRIEGAGDSHSTNIQIPSNARRAVLEIYVSFHGDDEFWYSNPPDSYIKVNNLTTARGNGAFREVYVSIDGKLVGYVVPFPVIFTGGINPLFWEPVVAIGAFNLPTYEIDLTPFLGILSDGGSHEFTIGVSDGISFWLVDANLHLWLDQNIFGVQAKTAAYVGPSYSIKRKSKFKKLDGSFEIEAKRKSKFEGWVVTWDQGNLTTSFEQETKFENSIKFQNNGNDKKVKQSVTSKTEIKITNVVGEVVGQASLKRKYPLKVITSTRDMGNGTYHLFTNVDHSLKERFSSGNISSSLTNSQASDGWMLVQDHNVLSGEAKTDQSYVYIDNYSCYTRNVAAVNGQLTRDNTSFICPNYW